MSEFDNLKNEAEQYAQQHPEQIKEGEETVEKKFGIGQQGPQGQGQDRSGQDQGQGQGQGQQQDQQDQHGENQQSGN